MEQMTNYLILIVVLIILIVIVVVSLSKRAKNDPKSLENQFYDFSHDIKGFDDLNLYDTVHKAELVSRASRPKYPSSNDYRDWLAMMEARNAQKEKESLEEMELW